MPEISHEDVTCPHCGAQASFTIYPYIDAVREQELKMNCLNGKVFEFICPACGQMSHIGYPLCYHDSEQHLMMQVINERDPLVCAGVMMLRQMEYGADQPELYTYRAVPTPAHLAEKVDIFSCCLDDRTVELQKHLMLPAVRQKHEDAHAMLLRIFENELIYAVINKAGQVVASIPFDRAAYDELHGKCAPFYPEDGIDNMYVDTQWAEEYFTPATQLQ